MYPSALQPVASPLNSLHLASLDPYHQIRFSLWQGPPAKCALRVLAQRYLKRRIQGGSHDSADDALAALDLALLKIKHGPAFGMPQQARVTHSPSSGF